MVKRFIKFWKQETVLAIALIAALVSMLFGKVDATYLSYIDLRVLCLLFALMAVVQGFANAGAFDRLTNGLLAGKRKLPLLVLLFTLLPFFLSMLVTNDVALIACVPFTFAALRRAGRGDLSIRVCVLETLAANLGSMATPVGNPQNLFLYSHYALSAGDFFAVVVPLTLVSLLFVAVLSLVLAPRETIEVEKADCAPLDKRALIAYVLLFVLCLLSVFRIVHYAIAAAAVLIYQLIFDRKLLKRVDYCLLLTFVCFFVFSGNLGRIEPVRSLLESLLNKNALLTGVLASQCISNVPAAVLLAPFTSDYASLLAGVNIGGLGTPIASLASLISLKFYLKEPEARIGRYLLTFTLWNVIGLVVLIGFSVIW